MRHTTLYILAFLLLFQSQAMANPLNETVAKRLKAQFSTLINDQKERLLKTETRLETQGEISVEQTDSYYAVTLPAISIVDVSGMTTKIGLIAVNAVPTDNTDQWRVSVSIPSPILQTNENGDVLTRLDIGTQQIGGVWNGASGEFLKLSGKFNDVTLNSANRQMIFTTNEMALVKNNSNYGVALKNLVMAQDANNKLLSIGDVQIKSNVTDIVNQDNQTLDFTLSYKDAVVQDENFLNKDLFPTNSTINLDFEKLPLEDVLDLLNKIIPKPNSDINAQQVALLQTMMRLPKILGEAGTMLEIKDTELKNDLYRLNISGDVETTNDSALSAFGDMTINMAGLQNLIEKLKQNPSQPLLKELQLIALICTPQNDLNTCRLSLKKDGRFFVNDQDISILTSLLQ